MSDREKIGYHRITIKILPGFGTTYTLTADSTADSTQPLARTEIDLDDEEIKDHLQRIEQGRADEAFLTKFGELLFSKIFIGDIHAAYINNLFDARQRSRPGVRIVLEIAREASALYRLPWTLMFDSSKGWWLGGFNAPLYQKTPLSFSVPGNPPLAPDSARPLRILAVGASPGNLRPLDIARELASVENGIREAERKGDIQLDKLVGVTGTPLTRQRLRERLVSWRPQILHFACHGPETKRDFYSPAGLFLEDEDGEADFCHIDVLQEMLQRGGATVRLVVFNVCNSDAAAWRLAQQGTPAIGMALPISVDAAGPFARALYEALARGIPIDEAINRGRAAIREAVTEQEREWIIPSLFLPQGLLLGQAVQRREIEPEPRAEPESGRPVRIPTPPPPPPAEPAPSTRVEEPIAVVREAPSILRLSSFPSGAEVVLNGVLRSDAITPVDLPVTAGEYTLQLRKKRSLALPSRRKVQVGSGATVPVWFLLLSPAWLLVLLLPLLVLVGQHLWVAWRPAPPGMVRIPGGSFTRGGEESPLLNLMREYSSVLDFDLVIEAQPGRGTIEQRIFIDRFEVTNGEYGRFLEALRQQGAGRNHTPELWNDESFNQPRQPVVGVNWSDADAYCRWAGKRLPSADEWERAARGDDGTDRLYPWGNEFKPEWTNTGEGPEPRRMPVGSFESDRSPDGVSDLGGNVSEWTGTPGDVGGGEGRLAVGGSWKLPGLFYSFVFLRRAGTLNYSSNDLGFRCARPAEPNEAAPPEMVAIPPGDFRKGGPESRALDLARRLSLAPSSIAMILGERPKKIELDEFYLDRHEVTQRDYARFLEQGQKQGEASGGPKEENDRVPSTLEDPELNRPDHPVVGVDWYDAVAYCRWAGKRLPTADEWEMAARGQEGRNYPWGEDFHPDRCNTAESGSGSGKTSPVGAHPECRTPEGVLDLVGNADEWTADAKGSSDGSESRVIKGGAWNESGEVRGLGYLRTGAEADYNGEDMGFRCAADPRESWLQKLLALLPARI